MASNLTNNINRFTEGLVSSTSDLMLTAIHFNMSFDLNEVNKVDDEERSAIESFYAIPKHTVKRSLRHLRTKGLAVENANKHLKHELTDEGREYLSSVIPQYQMDRPWDGRLYLVTYDVPRANNRQRNALRDYLKSLGAGLLQHSVWALTFNPREQIESFKAENNIENAFIVISSFGQEGGVLDKSLPDVAAETFNVYPANDLYKKFLYKHSLPTARERLIFHYLNALRNDPQLPFELYPTGWEGTNSREVFQNLL